MIYQSGTQFLNAPHKSITLMGMSGVGKSHLAAMMQGWGWCGYSCDLEIGVQFLGEHMARPVRLNDISALSDFIGKIGQMSYAEFKQRQRLYYEAEIASLKQAAERAQEAEKFVLDSTGSICEIMDDDVLARVGAATLFVYIEPSQQEELAILQRAQDYPKPLFYPPRQLDAWVDEYMRVYGVDGPDSMPSDAFSRWVFPRLFDMRIPKYQRLTEMYGVALPSRDVYAVATEDDLLNLIAAAIDARAGVEGRK